MPAVTLKQAISLAPIWFIPAHVRSSLQIQINPILNNLSRANHTPLGPRSLPYRTVCDRVNQRPKMALYPAIL
jgi:hypothetical protein